MLGRQDQGRRDRWLLAIAVFKYLKALLLIAVGLGALHLLDPVFVARAERITGTVVSPLGRQHVQHLLHHLSRMSPVRIEAFGVGAFLYAALFLIEGTGLWLHKHWAEYLTIGSTALLIPIEVYELVHRFTAPRVSTLAVNVAVLAYLLIRLRHRRIQRHHQGEGTVKQKIGVLGSGGVGQTLAAGFKKHGHEVRIASRTPDKLKDFCAKAGIAAGSFPDVAGWGEMLVLSVKGNAALAALKEIGAAPMRGKTVIDTTNPIADAPPVDGVVQFFTGPNSSLLEQLQAAQPETRFVKCFSIVGAAKMVDPVFKGGRPSMFICGNDAEARKDVTGVLDEFGWETFDMGSAVAARAIEPLCQLWCIPGFRQNHWTHAFKLLWD